MTRPAVACLALLLVLVAAGCGVTAPGAPPPLRIATDATFPPFHFLNDEGRPTGYDVELARSVAMRAGIAPEVAVVPYDDLLPGLDSGAHDLVAATTGVTPARAARYLFTASYFDTSQAVLVRDEPRAPVTLADLAGRRVGASGEGTSRAALEGLEGVEGVALGKGQAGLPALLAREIDALIVDEFDAVDAARASDGRLRVLAEPAALEHYAFVLAAGRDDLAARLNEALRALEDEGVVAGLRARFGVDRDAAWPVRLPTGSQSSQPE
jgi:ABC-type amino acid transport substrate-binding protein